MLKVTILDEALITYCYGHFIHPFDIMPNIRTVYLWPNCKKSSGEENRIDPGSNLVESIRMRRLGLDTALICRWYMLFYKLFRRIKVFQWYIFESIIMSTHQQVFGRILTIP